MKIIFFAIGFLFIFNNTGYCSSLTLIECGMMKDGGTRCVEYKKDGRVFKYCIDHRPRRAGGTNEVFNEYPTKPEARIINKSEMKVVFDDVIQLMNSDEYKKYSALTQDDLRSLAQEDNLSQLGKVMSYRYLEAFKDDLSTRFH